MRSCVVQILIILVVLPIQAYGQINKGRFHKHLLNLSKKDLMFEYLIKDSSQTYSDSGSWFKSKVVMRDTISYIKGILTFNSEVGTLVDSRFGCTPNYEDSLRSNSPFEILRCDTVLDTCVYCFVITGLDTTRELAYTFYEEADTVFFKEIVSGYRYPMLVLDEDTFRSYSFLPLHKPLIFFRQPDSKIQFDETKEDVYSLISYYENKYHMERTGGVEGEKEYEVFISKSTLIPLVVKHFTYRRAIYNGIEIRTRTYSLSPIH